MMIEQILKKEDALAMYRSMLRIRMTETAIADNYYNDIREMHTPVHLYDGQEAVAVGVCMQLNMDDVIFSNHRCHGQIGRASCRGRVLSHV